MSRYLEQPYNQRQFLMVVPDTSGLNVEGIDFFYKKFLPSDVRFPVGHPIQKVLYVAHPVEKGLYNPFDNS